MGLGLGCDAFLELVEVERGRVGLLRVDLVGVRVRVRVRIRVGIRAEVRVRVRVRVRVGRLRVDLVRL